MTEVSKQGNTDFGVTQNSRSVNISISDLFMLCKIFYSKKDMANIIMSCPYKLISINFTKKFRIIRMFQPT